MAGAEADQLLDRPLHPLPADRSRDLGEDGAGEQAVGTGAAHRRQAGDLAAPERAQALDQMGEIPDPHLADARDGRRYLDFFSFYASQPLGFNHPRLAETSFVNRLGRANIAVEGTGLGRALTRHLVLLMQGELAVSSEAGVGA